jgi:hypothetical protein
MKYELQKGTLGIIHWLQAIAKNKTISGGSTDLKDLAEVCWAFTLPLQEIEKMQRAKIDLEIKKFMSEMDAETWLEIQAHAEFELKKFFTTDVKPKKQEAPRKVQPNKNPAKLKYHH